MYTIYIHQEIVAVVLLAWCIIGVLVFLKVQVDSEINCRRVAQPYSVLKQIVIFLLCGPLAWLLFVCIVGLKAIRDGVVLLACLVIALFYRDDQ